MNKLYLLLVCCISSILVCGKSFGQGLVEIQGALKIAASPNNTPEDGIIRWTGTDLQVANGSDWISLIDGSFIEPSGGTTGTSHIVEIDGPIVVGDYDGTPEEGMIRWTGSDMVVWSNIGKWISILRGVVYDGEVTDVDGNTYLTKMINGEEWMTENLRTTRYNDGTPIPQVTINSLWSGADYGAWCWYNNNQQYEKPYGKLYNYYAVESSKNICPTGWRPASYLEILSIFSDYGGNSEAGKYLKEAGYAHWEYDFLGSLANNSTGFTALPGGLRKLDGNFVHLTTRAWYWTGREIDNDYSASFGFQSYSDRAYPSQTSNKNDGYSVRCVKI